MSEPKPTTNAQKREALTAIIHSFGRAIQTNDQVLINLAGQGVQTALLEALPDEVMPEATSVSEPVKTPKVGRPRKTFVSRKRKG